MQQLLPELPQETNSVYEDFFTQVLPFNTNNIHPRFWGWVQGGGTITGMLADMLASGMNAQCEHRRSYAHVCRASGDRLGKEMMGFPSTASGIL